MATTLAALRRRINALPRGPQRRYPRVLQQQILAFIVDDGEGVPHLWRRDSPTSGRHSDGSVSVSSPTSSPWLRRSCWAIR